MAIESNQDDEKPSIHRPFILASENDQSAVFSEKVIGLEKLSDDKTRAVTVGYGQYSYYRTIPAPLAVVREIFQEHGYDWVDTDELKTRTERYKAAQSADTEIPPDAFVP